MSCDPLYWNRCTGISRALEAARREKLMTQREFAELLGIPRGTYSHWARGNILPSASYMKILTSSDKLSTITRNALLCAYMLKTT